MTPLFQLFSLVWISVCVCCGAAEAARLQTWSSDGRSGRVLDGAGRQAMQIRSRSENVEVLDVLAENTGILDDFHEKGAEVVEVLAENTRDFEVLQGEGVEGLEVLVKKREGFLCGPVPAGFRFQHRDRLPRDWGRGRRFVSITSPDDTKTSASCFATQITAGDGGGQKWKDDGGRERDGKLLLLVRELS
jgi:hypothetical protein